MRDGADPDRAASPIPAGLRYADDSKPGYRRRLEGNAFVYYDRDDKRIDDARIIARINALAIPPAYQSVWICPDPVGHIQATGRDARGRKQYRYHPRWNEIRDADKYGRLLQFGQALSGVRAQIERDLRRRDFGRDRVLAAVISLLDATLVRVGNVKYARANKSFGLTTLRNRHTQVHGNDIQFQFRGKSGIDHDVRLTDARLARIVRKCLELPGQELFQYLDREGMRHPIDSADVNAYLRRVTGEDFTAKDYRTWAGSVLAFDRLCAKRDEDTRLRAKIVVDVVRDVAKRLANTPAICRRCYVHPVVIDAFLEGTMPVRQTPRAPRRLRADERRFLDFLSARARAA